jgi:hypothetical protein
MKLTTSAEVKNASFTPTSNMRLRGAVLWHSGTFYLHYMEGPVDPAVHKLSSLSTAVTELRIEEQNGLP